MNELSRLRGSERYGACADDSAGCRVAFSKAGPAGELTHTRPQAGVSEANRRLRRLLGRRCCRGQSPHTPSESPRHFAARRDESVIVGYYTSRRKCLPRTPVHFQQPNV